MTIAAHEFLRRRLPELTNRQRFWTALYLPLTMKMLCRAIVVPPKSFWREFDIPREVRKELFFGSPESRKSSPSTIWHRSAASPRGRSAATSRHSRKRAFPCTTIDRETMGGRAGR